jgi:anti-sigma factor RsiW
MTTSFRDVESLSAYLDGALSPADSARLEARLRSDPGLRAVMDDLRTARGVLRTLPSRRAPRRFTLTPQMAGVKPPLPRAYPVMRFATALATLLLVFTFAVNSLGTISLGAAAPAAPAFGMGGGGGGADPEAEAQLAEPPAEPAMAATEFPALPTFDAAADSAPAPGTATPDLTLKRQDFEEPFAESLPADEPAAPAPGFSWQWGLLLLVLALGGGTWLMRVVNDRSWRGKAR